MKRTNTSFLHCLLLRCMALLLTIITCLSALGQQYAGFVDDVRNATTDSLMNIDGMEYYLLYEDYEKVHFLSMLSDNREVSIIGPAVPADTLYQNGDICGQLGIETVRRPLSEMRNDSMLVTCKYPRLFERCETVSPCNFKVCDSNNFGYKLVFDFPTAEGEQWDYLRFWLINYVDTFTNMDMLYFDDVYLEKNLDRTQLPTEQIRRAHPDAFEIDDINDGQAIADHFRDMYMRQVYFLKNQDFTFPLSYLRIFMSPRYVDDRYVTYFISTNFYAYGAHDFPIERYVTLDLLRREVVTNQSLFGETSLSNVSSQLDAEMKRHGLSLGSNALPQAAIFGDRLVFSFQPYQIGSFADGISHFTLPRSNAKSQLQRRSKLKMSNGK